MLLFFFTFLTTAFAQLPADQFDCRAVKISETCVVSECVGEISPYPQTVAVIVPSQIKQLRIHLHGFSELMQGNLPLGPMNPNYDWNHLGYPTIALARAAHREKKKDGPSKMLKAFGMHKSACERSEVVVVPLSRGKCTTYKEFFANASRWKEFKSEVRKMFATPSWRLSGHSGAGAVIELLLNADAEALDDFNSLTLFDGFYAESQARRMLKWVEDKSGKTLTSITIASGKPRMICQAILKQDAHPTVKTFRPHLDEKLDHWSVVKKYWLD